MKSLGKKTKNSENGMIQVNSMADKTLVRFIGDGSCNVQAAWDEDGEDVYTFAKEQALMENVVVSIDVPIKFIKISGKSGEGKIVIEGYN